jgi:class 3 adenylate cyclase
VIPAQGRYLAEHIAGAQYLELTDGGHWPWTAPDADRFLDKLEEFLTGPLQVPGRDRVLATVAFTGIVDSTAMAATMGDRRWRELLEAHDSVAHREVEAARGRTVKSTGDGVLATFDGPARAIRCVGAIARGVATLGLHVPGRPPHRRDRAARPRRHRQDGRWPYRDQRPLAAGPSRCRDRRNAGSGRAGWDLGR